MSSATLPNCWQRRTEFAIATTCQSKHKKFLLMKSLQQKLHKETLRSIDICGVTLLLLVLACVVIGLDGCAARKPAKAQHPTAQMEIPRECATGFQWTKKTVCKSVANDPEHAVCSNVLVRHWCVRPATK